MVVLTLIKKGSNVVFESFERYEKSKIDEKDQEVSGSGRFEEVTESIE